MTDRLGRAIAWLFPLMALLTFVVVVLRYGFDQGSIALQEAVMYMHAMTFMLGIPYALKAGAHVRVDVFHATLSAHAKARIELAGHVLFLFPLCGVMFLYSLGYVASAWRVFEGSPEVGGIPAVFLLKTLLPVMAVLLFLQGIAESARHIAFLRNGGDR